MYHKDVVVVVNRHDDCGVPLGVLETCADTQFHPVPRTLVASRKGPLDGADPPSFSTRVVDPAQSSRDVPVNLTLQLTRRESSSVIKGRMCVSESRYERRSTK